MTFVEKWQALAKRFTFDHSPISIRLSVRGQEGDGVEITCHAISRHNRTGDPIRLYISEFLEEAFAESLGERESLQLIARMVRRMFDHEAREFTRLDGEVFDDPHAEEAMPPRPQHAEEMHKRASDSLRPSAQEP